MSRSSVLTRNIASYSGVMLAAVVLAGCATAVPGAVSTGSPSPEPSETSSVSPTTGPTAEPADSATPVPEPSASIGTDGGTGTSVVFITLDVVGDKIEASGMLPEVVEEGGSCTLTLTRGSVTRTVEGDTATGRESTFCSLLTVPTSELAPGDWTAVLTYSSAAHSGASPASTVSVP